MVRAGYEAFNRGDIEAALAPLHPDIEWWPAADEPITDPYRGHDGYRRLVTGIREAVPDLQIEVEELFVAGGRVVACLRFWAAAATAARPSRSAKRTSPGCATARSLRSASTARKDEALEAVGLRE